MFYELEALFLYMYVVHSTLDSQVTIKNLKQMWNLFLQLPSTLTKNKVGHRSSISSKQVSQIPQTTHEVNQSNTLLLVKTLNTL